MYAFSLLVSVINQMFPEFNFESVRDYHTFKSDLGMTDSDIEKLCDRLGDALGIVIEDPAKFNTVGELCEFVEDFV